MKVNVCDIEQFPDGKKYRLYFIIKKGRATDPVLEVTKSVAGHPDLLKLLLRELLKTKYPFTYESTPLAFSGFMTTKYFSSPVSLSMTAS